jgi:serine/threonine protein kinase
MDAGSIQGVTLQDLNPLYEAFDEDDDEHGNPVFLYSSFGYITQDFLAYFGRSPLRKYELTPIAIKENFKLLPDSDVYPKAPPGAKIISTPLHDKFFLKTPKLNTAFEGTGLLPELVSKEIEVLELLEKNPHPHIVRYHGCLIARDLVVGLVFDRHPKTLYQRLQENDGSFDVKSCMDSITDATKHLHALGLAHNDLNPTNVMVRDDDTICVIDFGSCRPFGSHLITSGSVGWTDEDFTTSDLKHDKVALNKIRDWLEGNK